MKGQAKQILMPLGTAVTIEQTLNKLEAVFGNVATVDSVMQEFYTARKEKKDKKLRDRFWNYLRNDRLKNATRTKKEKLTNFEDLRREVREENNMKARSGEQHQPTRQRPQNK